MVYCTRPMTKDGETTYYQKGLMLRMFTVSVAFPICSQTLPLSFTVTMLYGPFYGSSLNLESITFLYITLSFGV
jgi:hypothetical protein